MKITSNRPIKKFQFTRSSAVRPVRHTSQEFESIIAKKKEYQSLIKQQLHKLDSIEDAEKADFMIEPFESHEPHEPQPTIKPKQTHKEAIPQEKTYEEFIRLSRQLQLLKRKGYFNSFMPLLAQNSKRSIRHKASSYFRVQSLMKKCFKVWKSQIAFDTAQNKQITALVTTKLKQLYLNQFQSQMNMKQKEAQVRDLRCHFQRKGMKAFYHRLRSKIERKRNIIQRQEGVYEVHIRTLLKRMRENHHRAGKMAAKCQIVQNVQLHRHYIRFLGASKSMLIHNNAQAISQQSHPKCSQGAHQQHFTKQSIVFNDKNSLGVSNRAYYSDRELWEGKDDKDLFGHVETESELQNQLIQLHQNKQTIQSFLHQNYTTEFIAFLRHGHRANHLKTFLLNNKYQSFFQATKQRHSLSKTVDQKKQQVIQLRYQQLNGQNRKGIQQQHETTILKGKTIKAMIARFRLHEKLKFKEQIAFTLRNSGLLSKAFHILQHNKGVLQDSRSQRELDSSSQKEDENIGSSQQESQKESQKLLSAPLKQTSTLHNQQSNVAIPTEPSNMEFLNSSHRSISPSVTSQLLDEPQTPQLQHKQELLLNQILVTFFRKLKKANTQKSQNNHKTKQLHTYLTNSNQLSFIQGLHNSFHLNNKVDRVWEVRESSCKKGTVQRMTLKIKVRQIRKKVFTKTIQQWRQYILEQKMHQTHQQQRQNQIKKQLKKNQLVQFRSLISQSQQLVNKKLALQLTIANRLLRNSCTSRRQERIFNQQLIDKTTMFQRYQLQKFLINLKTMDRIIGSKQTMTVNTTTIRNRPKRQFYTNLRLYIMQVRQIEEQIKERASEVEKSVSSSDLDDSEIIIQSSIDRYESLRYRYSEPKVKVSQTQNSTKIVNYQQFQQSLQQLQSREESTQQIQEQQLVSNNHSQIVQQAEEESSSKQQVSSQEEEQDPQSSLQLERLLKYRTLKFMRLQFLSKHRISNQTQLVTHKIQRRTFNDLLLIHSELRKQTEINSYAQSCYQNQVLKKYFKALKTQSMKGQQARKLQIYSQKKKCFEGWLMFYRQKQVLRKYLAGEGEVTYYPKTQDQKQEFDSYC